MSAPDLAAIIKHAQLTEHVNSRSDNAKDILAAKVPELCHACGGSGLGTVARPQRVGGQAVSVTHEPCPDCPTIAKLLAIGASVMMMQPAAEIGIPTDNTYDLGWGAGHDGLLEALRKAEP